MLKELQSELGIGPGRLMVYPMEYPLTTKTKVKREMKNCLSLNTVNSLRISVNPLLEAVKYSSFAGHSNRKPALGAKYISGHLRFFGCQHLDL